MGVHGLWRLIEPSGKPVPVESLENKILAVDVSIWLHQAIKGFQDAKGAPALNAHLLVIFHRICKLLYFKVRPVFVFDGGVPALKRETIAKRNKLKNKNILEGDKIQKQLLDTLVKHSAINKILADKLVETANSWPKSNKIDNVDDVFKLPATKLETEQSDSEDESSSETSSGSPTKNWNLHNIDTKSQYFKSLPAEVRHDILSDLKETRKQSSWGKLHELPKQSDDFSIFQMKRLLKRQEVQLAIEEAEKEMGGHSLSLMELEEILKDQGVITKSNIGNRIASDENTRYLFIRDVKKALEDARKLDEHKTHEEEENSKKTDLELERDTQLAIQLSLQDQPSSSGCSSGKLSDLSFMQNLSSDNTDSDESDDLNMKPKLTSAQNYMMEYSGLNLNEINRIISVQGKGRVKRKLEEMKEDETNGIKKPKPLEMDLQPSGGSKAVKKPEQIKVVNSILPTISDTDSNDDFEEVKLPVLPTTDDQDHSEEVPELPKEISESDDSEENFEEVEELPQKATSDALKITVDTTNFTEEDDLFADVFVENKNDHLVTEVSEVASNHSTAIHEPIDDTETVERTNKDLISTSTKKEKNITNQVSPVKKLTDEELIKMRDTLNDQQLELRKEQGLTERLGTNITDQMYKEAQELLELFGLPYVIAPMEAEAQCAFLETANLVDGTITDDSDIWLFGGKTVYKNFFNQAKHVLEYRADSIKDHFKLTREQMILLALLVGSDYTTGLQGVGPVTALEILASFPPNSSSTILSYNQILEGLVEFKSWFTKSKAISKGKNSLRSKLKNVSFTENFPSVQVVQAYLNPIVDPSDEKFSWSKPDVQALVDFGRIKFGWSKTKTEDILKPVLKRLKETRYQSNLLNYFKIKHLNPEEAKKLMSERVKSAIEKFGKEPQPEEPENDEKIEKKTKKKIATKRKKVAETKTDLFDDSIDMSKVETLLESLEKDEKSTELKSDVPQKKAATKVQRKKPSKTKPKTTGWSNSEVLQELSDEVRLIQETEETSNKMIQTIKSEAEAKITQELDKGKLVTRKLHQKEVIPQREREQKNLIKTKLKAIEIFRKTKIDPATKKRGLRKVQAPKPDAGLSESSSDSDL